VRVQLERPFDFEVRLLDAPDRGEQVHVEEVAVGVLVR
jgi:hypothetical protein